MIIAVLLLVAAQLLLIGLDLWQHWQVEQPAVPSDASAPSRRWQVGGFLLVITGIYFLLQWTGGRLVPNGEPLIDAVNRFVVETMGSHASRDIVTADMTIIEQTFSPGNWLVLIGLFYLAGFWDYVLHRFFSHSRWFWVTHEYHHLPRVVMVWMPGILVRPFGWLPVVLSTVATAATLALLQTGFALPLWSWSQFLPVLLAVTLILTASHSAFLRRSDRLHRVLSWVGLTSPQDHLLHHQIGASCNYGNFTTLWDRICGTYRSPCGLDLQRIPLGLEYDQDFLGAVTLGRLHLNSRVRKKFEVGRFCNLEDSQP